MDNFSVDPLPVKVQYTVEEAKELFHAAAMSKVPFTAKLEIAMAELERAICLVEGASRNHHEL